MKHLFISFTLLFFVYISHASHVKGGYITYSHISGRSYEITLLTISDPTSPADPNNESVDINFGDSKSETIQRTSFQLVNAYTKTNTYTVTHTYEADGNYIISYKGHNFINNIVNVNMGYSDNVAFYVESTLSIDNAVGIANSAVPHSFLADPIAIQGQDFSYSTTSFNEDGDSLFYELVPTLSEISYSSPEGLTIDSRSGMLNWSNIAITGTPTLYFIYYKVSTYKSNTLTGSMIIGQTIKTIPSTITFPTSVNFPFCDITLEGWHSKTITSNTPFQQQVKSTNSSYSPSAYGETSLSLTNQSTPSDIDILMNMNADSKMVHRECPYFYTVRLTKENTTKDYTLAIYFPSDVTSGINELTSTNTIKTYPNPLTHTCTFQLNTIGEYALIIRDITGKKVFETSFKGDVYEWNAEELKSGSYFYTLQDNKNANTVQGKLILTQ